jgi:hypothetical protein
MEGGVLRYSGTAAELKAKPELLHSAYLLRGAAVAPGKVLDGTLLDGTLLDGTLLDGTALDGPRSTAALLPPLPPLPPLLPLPPLPLAGQPG